MRNLLFAVLCLTILLALIWPGYAFVGNRIEPRILGLPFSLSWNVLCVATSFVGMLAYHLTRARSAPTTS